ncbi:SDR family oxidoreductase [Leptospira sp. GIMC2001]|uniref:SDR family oxidoreductase n=1 Tax=Leptospira sp. GIMC2001 TaxID=1513297 RepID=UPI00234B7CC1|nr:SDR family oxidoreductase [Leptospira sp. GIMC2001]WCL48526.1 SDR family oxidoreductase [Leptospira sp. GIMC2001]
MSTTFKDKVVWITGASSGIGEALVFAFAEEGAKVILSSRKKEDLIRVQKESNLDDSRSLILPLDLEKNSSFDKEAATAIKKIGVIDIIIHNGGISQRSLVADTKLEVYRRLNEVNYMGAVSLTLSTLPHFLKQGHGLYVVVTSIVGKIGTPLRSGYSASKHALHGFFDSLRAECSDSGLSVLMVCPGFIKTKVSINALVGSGKNQGKMDDAQAKGMDPRECAKQILDGIRSKKEEIMVSGIREKAAVYAKRFFPGILSKMIKNAKVT